MRQLSGINTCAQPVASEMSPVRSGMGSVVSGCSSIVCDDCLGGAAALRLTHSLFFRSARVGGIDRPELDCDGPDYRCRRVAGHVVVPEAPRARPGRRTMGEKEKRRRGVASLAEIAFSSVGYRSTRPHAD